MRILWAWVGLAVCVVLVVACVNAQEKKTQVVALKAARLIDGKNDAVANGVVVIEGDKITAVGSGVAIPAGAKVIDWEMRRCCRN